MRDEAKTKKELVAEQQLRVSERTHKGAVLVFADLDGLTQINDTLGHLRGDEALIEAAEIFREAFRGSDIIARMGGDEFAILALDASESLPERLIDRLQECIAAHNARGERDYTISVSVGIVPIDPRLHRPLFDWMSRADALMYGHKQSRRM